MKGTQNENIKIPAVYYEKSKNDRLREQNELLTRFQKLLSAIPEIKGEFWFHLL